MDVPELPLDNCCKIFNVKIILQWVDYLLGCDILEVKIFRKESSRSRSHARFREGKEQEKRNREMVIRIKALK